MSIGISSISLLGADISYSECDSTLQGYVTIGRMAICPVNINSNAPTTLATPNHGFAGVGDGITTSNRLYVFNSTGNKIVAHTNLCSGLVATSNRAITNVANMTDQSAATMGYIGAAAALDYIKLDLGSIQTLNIGVLCKSLAAGNLVKLQYSTDDAAWSDGSVETTISSTCGIIALNKSCRYIRLYCTTFAAAGQLQVMEFFAYTLATTFGASVSDQLVCNGSDAAVTTLRLHSEGTASVYYGIYETLEKVML